MMNNWSVDQFNRMGRQLLFWTFVLAIAFALINLNWSHAYAVGNTAYHPQWADLILTFFFVVPITLGFILEVWGRRIPNEGAKYVKAFAFSGIFEAFMVYFILSFFLAPSAHDTEQGLRIQDNIQAVVSAGGVDAPDARQALAWLQDPKTSEQYAGQIEQIAKAKTDPQSVAPFLKARELGVRSEAIEFVERNGMVRDRDIKALGGTMKQHRRAHEASDNGR